MKNLFLVHNIYIIVIKIIQAFYLFTKKKRNYWCDFNKNYVYILMICIYNK